MSDILSRLGNVLYWGGSIIAVLLIVGGIAGFIIGISNGKNDGELFLIVTLYLFAPAIAIWLLGRAARYVLSGK